MAVNLTSGAISRISTGKCTENDLKPVLQMFHVNSLLAPTIDNKKWSWVVLSDGSFLQSSFIAEDFIISNKLQKGSIVQLIKFRINKGALFGPSRILVFDLTVIHSKCDIIGDDPKKFFYIETPSAKLPTSKQKQDHVNLTPGAIANIMTDKCTSNDLPVLQLTFVRQDSRLMCSINGKQWYTVLLSDGSFEQVCCFAEEIFISKQLEKGSIVRLTKFQLVKDCNILGIRRSGILVFDLTVIRSKCDRIGNPKRLADNEIPLVERTAPTISDDDSEDDDSDFDNSHPAEEPSATTQKCSSHFPTKNNTDTIMGVNLTPGAITKIMTDKCTSNDPKPVVQVINIDSRLLRSEDDKKWYLVGLSDGSFKQYVAIAYEILISNELQQGSIIQLTRYHKRVVARAKYLVDVCDLHVIRSKCDIIGDPRLIPYNKAPLMENFVPPISDHKRADSDLNEDVDDSNCGEEPPDLKQNPSDSTQSSSSHSLTQSKKRKCQSSNDDISAVLKDISKSARTMMEKNKEDGVDACFKKLEELKEDVSKLTRMMMEKNKEDEVGSCKRLETLEEDVSKLTRMMMEKNKEDVMGFKKLETREQDFFNMTRMAMEKNKEDVGSCKRLETLEEYVSKLTRMMMEKNKEDVMGFNKLETLEKDVSKMTELMMDKSIEVDAGFKKLETLEENVSKMTKSIMEKNKEDDVGSCFKKLEALGEDVSEMSRMMMKICKEDDMGACIRKLEKIGWGAQDPMYDTALLLFGQSADYRNLWLHLKPESCGNWVKNAGSMFGLLD